MTGNPTVFEPRNTSDATGGEVTAAVDAALTELASEAHPLANG
jgi:hypothetical protein